MSDHRATVSWERGGAAFTDHHYSRGHVWTFDGGLSVPASASPHLVRAPYSVREAVDPEEAFVASLSSCHMLWFLHFAAERGWVVERYRDEALGVMERDPAGRLAMTRVMLRPEVHFAGAEGPDGEELRALHHTSHDRCFIANSVKTDVRCEPREATG